jgi:type I restriction enzyme S subunit
MANWRDCKLGDVLTLKRRYDLPQREREPGPFPIVSSSGITGYHLEAKAKGPGVVTGRYGTLGEVFYITQSFWPLNTSLYVKDFKNNDPRFVSYLLRTLNFESKNAAGAVPGVNRNHLHEMDVCVPPVLVQRRIAGILSAYDDLIENNLRRIRILEEMARSLLPRVVRPFPISGSRQCCAR